ncbi:MAG TPA: hypothetical protein VMC86_11325 [Gemmatimonadales bacterium]|nr:hypothetical protein [Gemmatimonadales bacterium]
MPTRRSPVLAVLLALALLAYPATMPAAMLGQAAHQHGQCEDMQHPGGHHHSDASCCVGVCGSCPVLAVLAAPVSGLTAAITDAARSTDVPAAPTPAASRRLPFPIGPPRLA